MNRCIYEFEKGDSLKKHLTFYKDRCSDFVGKAIVFMEVFDLAIMTSQD